MIVSEKIKEYCPEINIETISEKQVDSLGLASCNKVPICGFIGSTKFVNGVSDQVKTVIINESLIEKFDSNKIGLIIVDNPQDTFWKLHQIMHNDYEYVRPKKDTVISENAKVGDYVSISNNNVVIEDDVVIEDFVTIYENTYIKKGSVIRSGSRLGGVGFQEYKNKNRIETINHYGGVIIGENVDIQNNACIDRALFPWEDTIIGDETKIDNMVHIAHAVEIGKGCEIAANAVIAGRCVIGDNVWIGLGALIKNFAIIGNDSRVNIGSVVVNEVSDGGSVSGNYAVDHKRFLFTQMRINKIK